jgi:hypothetical protein
MNTEKELRASIDRLEVELKAQTTELEELFETTLQQLLWKNMLTETLRAVLYHAPLQQLFFQSTWRFGAFRIGMALFEKFKTFIQSAKTHKRAEASK